MNGIGSLNETARNMSRGPRGIAGYQQFAGGGEGVRPRSRPPQMRPQPRPPEIEEMAEIRNYLGSLSDEGATAPSGLRPRSRPEKYFEINSYDINGETQNAIDFKDGMRMFMPDVERMITSNRTATEPMVGRETGQEVLEFLQENNPTSEEFINYFSSARLADGGQVTAPMATDIRGEAHRLAYINPSEQEMLYAMGGTGEPGPGGIPAFRGRGAADPRKFGDTSSARSAWARSGGFVDDGNSSGTGYTKTRAQASSVPAGPPNPAHLQAVANFNAQVAAPPPPKSNPFLDGAKKALRGIFSLNSFNNSSGIAGLSRPTPVGMDDANKAFSNSMKGVGNLAGSNYTGYTDTAGQALTTGPKNTRLMNMPSLMGMGIRGLARVGGIKSTDPVVNTVGGERVYKMDGGDHYIMNKTTGLPYMVEGPNDLTFSSKHQARMDTMMGDMMDASDESGPNSCGPGYMWDGTMCVPVTGAGALPGSAPADEGGVIKYASDFLPQTQMFADGGQVMGGLAQSPMGISSFAMDQRGPPPLMDALPSQQYLTDMMPSPNMGQPLQQYGQYLEQQYGEPDFAQKRDQFLQEVSQKEQQTFQDNRNLGDLMGGGPQPFYNSQLGEIMFTNRAFDVAPLNPSMGPDSVEYDFLRGLPGSAGLDLDGPYNPLKAEPYNPLKTGPYRGSSVPLPEPPMMQLFADGGPVYMRKGGAANEGDEPLSEYRRALIDSESSGRYGVKNSKGYVGLTQAGPEALSDFKKQTGQAFTEEQYLADPGLQLDFQDWYEQKTINYVMDKGLDKYIGKVIKGVPITMSALLGMAHIGGDFGMQQFLETGGRYDPNDGKTSLSDYGVKFSNMALYGESGGENFNRANSEDIAMSMPVEQEGSLAFYNPKERPLSVDQQYYQDMRPQARPEALDPATDLRPMSRPLGIEAALEDERLAEKYSLENMAKGLGATMGSGARAGQGGIASMLASR